MIILAQLPVPSFITDSGHLANHFAPFLIVLRFHDGKSRLAHFFARSEVPAQAACRCRTGSSLPQWLASWTRAVVPIENLAWLITAPAAPT